jgi:replication-associated recombination protein RarA
MYLTLDDRRPRLLSQIVGNQPVVSRLRQQLKNGHPPRRSFFYGPTGAGKTTLARILTRYAVCRNRLASGDPCGRCDSCTTELDEFCYYYHEWTGGQVNTSWQWWLENIWNLFRKDYFVIFIDEAQELHKDHQAEFRTRLEAARATIIFTTTHLHLLDDALINRFGVNLYELKRPTIDEVADHVGSICTELGVKAERHHLIRVADHYGCDLRRCVDFAHTALDQTEGGLVTDDYVSAVLGLDPAKGSGQAEPPTRRSRF